LVHEREDRGLDRGEARVELEDLRARAALIARVRLADDRQHAAVEPRGGLDDVRNVSLALARAVGQQLAALRVEVVQLRAGVLLVLREVVAAAVGDPLKLAETRRGEGEAVLDVAGALRIVRELILLVLAQDEVLAREPDRLPPLHAE